MTDADMVRSIKSWPRWPWLPVKRTVDGGLECAVIHADKETRVYLVGLYRVPGYFPNPDTKFIDYASVEDLLKEWTVD